MENKNNTTFYSIGLKDLKRKELKSRLSLDLTKLSLLVRLKILFE